MELNLNNLLLGFCEPGTPLMEGVVDFHNYIFLSIILVFIFVIFIMITVLVYFWYFLEKPNKIWDIMFREFIYLNNKVIHNTFLEVVWTIIPIFILIIIAFPSFSLLYSMDEVMLPIFTLKIIGHQWYWSYEYIDQNYVQYIKILNDNVFDNKKDTINKLSYSFLEKNYNLINKIYNSDILEFYNLELDSYMLAEIDLKLGDFRLLEVTESLVLPINVYIRVLVSSSDVLHCFALPSLGIKVDAIPGRLNQISLFLKRYGVFYGQCSEICGVSHGMMPIVIRGVSLDEYLNWLSVESINIQNTIIN